ncbi:MAG: family 20 glycosylhydrolase, partial [Defluviitaleaceae bacterium]|nr:family 20 glycosylhydrolase [Defluviitaleaceae bacterium]
ERYIDIIPEAPSFSHCDYLLTRHPELREKKNDDYADTYCPSDERSYALIFDVLDEVIDVFRPKMINIGHDEAYSIGVCEACAEKDPVGLYSGDIRRIYDYLAGKGVATMIWGEKLLNASTEEGPAGGAAQTVHYETGLPLDKPVPAIYPAIEQIPKDCQILHWYWGIGGGYDEEYHKHGLQVTYGNFSPTHFKNWRERLERGVRGAICSNWSDVKQENLQRNGMLYDLAFCGRLFWEDDYADDMRDEFDKRAFQDLFVYHYGKLEHGFRVVHSTDYFTEYKMFFDGNFIIDRDYDLGYYLVTYADQTRIRLPVRYGYNISNENIVWDGPNRSLAEIAFTARPAAPCQAAGGKIRYETIYGNPHPDKTVQSVAYVKYDTLEANVALFAFEVF